ncbi:MAG: TlpA family protein disulfide reductase [Frankiaceae bacterium]|nr:TlpA family protein disulfide reductase [Frankiaceae bacterium]
MRAPAGPIALCALTAALLSGCTGKNATTDGTSGPLLRTLGDGNHILRVEDRIPAPTIRGVTLDGDSLDVRSLRGKVVVLNFWASWCAPCRAESPNLVKVATDNASNGVTFVGVNFKDDRGSARRFDDVHAVPYPSLFDQPGVILTRFRTLVPQQPPSTVLIDRSGRIAGIFRGGVTETELSGPVQALAAESA